MRTIIPLFVLVLPVLAGCKKAPLRNGEIIEETRKLNTFRVITVYDMFNVSIRLSDPCRAVITAGENIVPHITTRMSGDTLMIGNQSRMRWIRDYDKPLITLYTDTIREIFFRGPSRITTPEVLKGTKLILWVIDDYCEANLTLDYHHIFVVSSRTNVSELRLQGRSTFCEMLIENGCSVKATGLETLYASVISHAVTDVYIGVKGTLVAHLFNTGHIYVTGRPLIIEKIKQSSGDLLYYP